MRKLSGAVFIAAIWTVLTAAAFQGTPLAVGYWPLDEVASPSLNLAGAYGNGTWSGAPTVSAATNQAALSYPDPNCLSFRGPVTPGTPDSVELASSPLPDATHTNNYTLAAWVRPAALPPTGVANEGLSGILFKSGWHLGLAYDVNSRFVMQHWTAADPMNPQDIYVISTGTHGIKAWYHVAATVDRVAGIVRIYVNGTDETPASGNTFPANTVARDYGTMTWKIGAGNFGANSYGSYPWAMNGLIDDVRIYNASLTPVEISALSLGVPAPTGLTATPAIRAVDLAWTAPPQAVTYVYTVERSPAGANMWTALATNYSGTTFTDITGLPAVSYDYHVTATSVATSGPSNIGAATRIEPPPRTEKLGGDHHPCGCSTAGAPGLAALGVALGLLLLCLRPR